MVDLEFKARSGKLEDEVALLRVVQGMLIECGPIDEQWIWGRNNPHALLNRVKLSVVRNPATKLCEDTQECNDSFEMTSDLNAGDFALANLAPEGLDVDFYSVKVQPPPELKPPPEVPPRPPTVTLKFPKVAQLRLQLSFFDTNRKLLFQKNLEPNSKDTEFRFQVSSYGRHFVKIEAEPSVKPWPADTRYQFKYTVDH